MYTLYFPSYNCQLKIYPYRYLYQQNGNNINYNPKSESFNILTWDTGVLGSNLLDLPTFSIQPNTSQFFDWIFNVVQTIQTVENMM